jgi:hypothetical protein
MFLLKVGGPLGGDVFRQDHGPRRWAFRGTDTDQYCRDRHQRRGGDGDEDKTSATAHNSNRRADVAYRYARDVNAAWNAAAR